MRLISVLLALTAIACGGGDDDDRAAGGDLDGSPSGEDAPSEGSDGSLPAGDTYTLTLSVVGQGVVTSEPAGIRCGNPATPETSDCTAELADGTSVTLTATANAQNRFDGWAGDCDGDGSCTLVMDEPRYAAATFQKVSPPDTCPEPASGKVTVCGRVHDLADTLPAGGMRLLVFEFDQFMSGVHDPIASFGVTATGTFVAADLPAPSTGRLVLATDDAAGSDARALTAVIVAAAEDTTVEDIVAFSLRRTTDEAWRASAGDPFAGLTFSIEGALVTIYIDTTAPAVGPFGGAPAPGVTVTASGSTQPFDDFYFEDTGPLSRTMPTTQRAETGANGTALLVRSAFGPHNATGGAPPGCAWPGHLIGAVPDAVVVQIVSSDCP